MKNTMLPLLKFKCDSKPCQFECFINQNNHILMAYGTALSAIVEWKCPECGNGMLRYAPTNVQFNFSLQKQSKNDTINPHAKYIDPND